ncbi:MAG: CBS domain-containing protein [Chitinophagaceae bacterium]
MKTVSDIMDSKAKVFNQIKPDALVIDALRLLNSVNLSYLVVVVGNDYKGIFGERDYARNVILKGRASDSTQVQEVMTSDLPIVAMGDSVEDCMTLMNQHKTRYLLAFDSSAFQGVVTIHDLLRQVIFAKQDPYSISFANTTRDLLDYDESSDKIY